MNSYTETISPAVKDHAAARIDFYNDLTLALLQSMRELSEINLQFSRTWLEETTDSFRTTLQAQPGDKAATLTPALQAIPQQLQAYQRQLAQVASDFQNNINRVTQQHVPQTTQTASELAKAMTQKAAEQTEQNLRAQKAAGDRAIDASSQFAQMATQRGAAPQPASMQKAGDAAADGVDAEAGKQGGDGNRN
jgi:hypothetical protein